MSEKAIGSKLELQLQVAVAGHSNSVASSGSICLNLKVSAVLPGSTRHLPNKVSGFSLTIGAFVDQT